MSQVSTVIQSTRWSQPAILMIWILFVALGLRVWGIWFGLPHIFHNDEDLEVVRALQLGSGSFDFQRIYKGGYFYLLFFEYGILFVVLKLFGIVQSTTDFAHYYFRDPTAFYLVGRATTAIIGALNVYLVYQIGRLAYSARVGVIGAALLAVNILHVKLSHYTTVDVPMTCLATAALYFAVKIAVGGSRSDYLWAAVLAALATTTKITAVMLLVPLAVSHAFSVIDRTGSMRQFFSCKLAWQAVAAFVLVYVVTTPGIVINFSSFFGFMLGKFGIGAHGASIDAVQPIAQETMRANTNLFEYYFEVLRESMTWPVFLVSLAGVAYGLWRRKRVDLVLISWSLMFYLVLSMSTDTKEFYPRYMLPVIPVLTLLGARFLDEVVGKNLQLATRIAMKVVLVVLLGALPVYQIAADNYLMTQKDTRAIAYEWFGENVPAGSKVVIEGTRTRHSESTIPLNNSAENVQAMIDYYRHTEPGKAKYFSMELENTTGPTFDLVLVGSQGLRDLQFYKETGVEYFVLRPRDYVGSRRSYEWPRVVDEIRDDPDISLVKEFEPDPKNRPGPYIEIYRVNKE